ncbi:ATP-binding protein [Sorangium sp. So ce406]|uniref:ATP-binding protein n=1 Tax=Sorangium sp. So ce406 TaxID=3133311 RepID=UPI003F5BC0D3
MAPVWLPSRYENLDIAFRGRLRPSAELNQLVINAFKGMKISGGIRFLPVFGLSGSGKTSAALELGTHLPECLVTTLERTQIESVDSLQQTMARHFMQRPSGKELLIFVVDQYEEVTAEKESVPKRFVESLSLLDRSQLGRYPILILWLTTSRDFQKLLCDATTRNRRVLVEDGFELHGPPRAEWSSIVEETFSFHNHGKSLADFEVMPEDIARISASADTLGTAVEHVGSRLHEHSRSIVDLSNYQVIMLWPVTDGKRLAQVVRFTDARSGYKLQWESWYRSLNKLDQKQLPLQEYNRARLYFDMRLIPIAAADLMPLCKNLHDSAYIPKNLSRFTKTHFYYILNDAWNPDAYSPQRERDSERATNAKAWYADITSRPVFVGQRIAAALRELGVDASHEAEVRSAHAAMRADVLVVRPGRPTQRIVELKVFAPKNTTPSGIRDAVRTTLKRHAQFAGFIPRQ